MHNLADAVNQTRSAFLRALLQGGPSSQATTVAANKHRAACEAAVSRFASGGA